MSDRPGLEVEISLKMAEAGAEALAGFSPLEDSPLEAAEQVYRAMLKAKEES